jgi:hypothetical protein
MLKETIKIATKRLVDLYKLVGKVEHAGEKGIFRELFISQLIHPLLPFQFGIGSGIVIDKMLKQSRQCDLIIYDRRLLPPILVAEGRGIFPIDSVLAIVEVKSKLRAEDYKQISDAARRFNPQNNDYLHIYTEGKIESKGKSCRDAIYPLYAAFAYSSDSPKVSEIDRLNNSAPDHGNSIQLIGVLDKGIWWFNRDKWESEPNDKIEENSAKFLMYLLNRLTDTANSRGDYRLDPWIGN